VLHADVVLLLPACCASQVWRQQNSQRWYDNPLICQDCMMLSPDCMDLLNKIFNLDMAKRCVRSCVYVYVKRERRHPCIDTIQTCLAVAACGSDRQLQHASAWHVQASRAQRMRPGCHIAHTHAPNAAGAC
jgi:hypothetical protein